MSITDPFYDANEGYFRPLTVIAPEGSVLNAQPPSPTLMYVWPAAQAANLLHKCLVEVIPTKVVARSGGDIVAFLWSVKTPKDGSSYSCGIDAGIGEGAGIDNDGENALVSWMVGDSYNIPVEIWEERYPLFIEKYSLWNDSCGAGKLRGGLGTEHVIRAEDDVTVISIAEQTKFPGWGLRGGKDALPNAIVARGETSEEIKGKFITDLHEGDYLVVHPGGGGGFGNPYERDPQRVLDDVLDEYISVEKAKEDYGVAIKKEGEEYTIDHVETEKLRKKK